MTLKCQLLTEQVMKTDCEQSMGEARLHANILQNWAVSK